MERICRCHTETFWDEKEFVIQNVVCAYCTHLWKKRKEAYPEIEFWESPSQGDMFEGWCSGFEVDGVGLDGSEGASPGTAD